MTFIFLSLIIAIFILIIQLLLYINSLFTFDAVRIDLLLKTDSNTRILVRCVLIFNYIL